MYVGSDGESHKGRVKICEVKGDYVRGLSNRILAWFTSLEVWHHMLQSMQTFSMTFTKRPPPFQTLGGALYYAMQRYSFSDNYYWFNYVVCRDACLGPRRQPEIGASREGAMCNVAEYWRNWHEPSHGMKVEEIHFVRHGTFFHLLLLNQCCSFRNRH